MPREIPAQLLAHFRSRYRTLSHCWAIKPKRGDWEGYCSHGAFIDLPAYAVGTPLEIPAMRYRGEPGLNPTVVPSSLNLEGTRTEGTVLIGALAFDRGKLLRGYYQDAQFEAFVINYANPSQGRDVKISGKFGKVTVNPNSAEIELIPWPSLADAKLGRTCNQLCDVGCHPGENFGTGRCRNVTLNDGPLRANWSVLATITAVTSAHQFTITHGGTAISSAALPTGFDAHLEAGDVEFVSTDEGGENAGVERQIKSAAGGTLTLHQELPFVPQVGDQLVLVAGCRRTVSDCQFYENMPNYRGFNLLPGKIGVLNTKTEES